MHSCESHLGSGVASGMNTRMRLFACALFGFLLFCVAGRSAAIDDRDIDALIKPYLQARNPNGRKAAFWEAIRSIREESGTGDARKAVETATRLASSLRTEDAELLSAAEAEIGTLQVQLGNWTHAKTHFANALRLEESRPAGPIERFEYPLMWLAGVAIQLGDLSDAESCYLRLLQMKQEAYGPLHYRTIGQLWALANLGVRQRDLAKAERHVNQELAIWRTNPKFMGEPVGDASTALQNLGAIRAHQGRLDDAIAAHLQARTLLAAPLSAASAKGEEVGGGALSRAMQCEERLASLYLRKGDAARAEMHAGERQKLQALSSRPAIVASPALWHQSLLPLP